MAINEIRRYEGLSDWQDEAACKDEDPELFFHPDGERLLAKRAKAERARDICATCPVIVSCDLFSYRSGDRHGTWAGLSEMDRQKYYFPKGRQKEDVQSWLEEPLKLRKSPPKSRRRRAS